MNFGSKAETLEALEGKLSKASVLPQYRFTVKQWNQWGNRVDGLPALPEWINNSLIVRSSGLAEDSSAESLAGHFTSVCGVTGMDALQHAIEEVIASFHGGNPEDQVFIQPQVTDVAVSGVAFTKEPSSGASYYVVNYDDITGSTSSVTEGASDNLSTYYQAKDAEMESGWLHDLISLLYELEVLFSMDSLDVEFAVSSQGHLYLLQVRPLVLLKDPVCDQNVHQAALEEVHNKVSQMSKRHPYLCGEKSVFGVMPDWNPAEIIGVRPRALALSLYKELVTDNIWAYQRDNYGYRNLRSFPLLITFAGQPYIDVRVSCNSFIPSDIENDLAEKLVNYYIDKLCNSPSHHDKVEFEIIHSCYTLDIPDKLQKLTDAGFSQFECRKLEESLRKLTNTIIRSDTGLWKVDANKIEVLKERQDKVLNSELNTVGKIYWLLEDCKRYGTLPFAGLARAGFIAVQMLQSLVDVGVLSDDDYHGFMASLNTVSSSMANDLNLLDKSAFLEKYGHLRPGTYDILSSRYDEEPGQYFDWSAKEDIHEPKEYKFRLDPKVVEQLDQLLVKHGLDHNTDSLFDFFRSAIECREYAKFVFTRSVSEVLRLFEQFGKKLAVDRVELAHADIDIIRKLYSTSSGARSSLLHSIEEGKQQYDITCSIHLPPLISNPSEVYSFTLLKNEPNFVTLESVRAGVKGEDTNRTSLKGNILMIPSADPGYDWIFSQGISGFVTMYGGVNSHMAIRAGELGIPAVIGAGETLFNKWFKAKVLEIDCANKFVQVIR